VGCASPLSLAQYAPGFLGFTNDFVRYSLKARQNRGTKRKNAPKPQKRKLKASPADYDARVPHDLEKTRT